MISAEHIGASPCAFLQGSAGTSERRVWTCIDFSAYLFRSPVTLSERGEIFSRKKSPRRRNMGCEDKTIRSWRPALPTRSATQTHTSGSKTRDGGFSLSGVRGGIDFAGKAIAGDEGGSKRDVGCRHGRVGYQVRQDTADTGLDAEAQDMINLTYPFFTRLWE